MAPIARINPTGLAWPEPSEQEDEGDEEVVTLVPDPEKPKVVVELADGSVTVQFGKQPSAPLDQDKGFGANLALELSDNDLGTLAEELLQGIEEDDHSRSDWLDERAEGIKLLALKIEKPSNSQAGSTAGVDNTSRVRHTLLLEAALRFQANARGELLPTEGPVKVSAKGSKDTIEDDDLAQLLEDDLNYYLTVTASEYYPDTDRMLLWTGVGGTGFKKVYRCPLRRRPVSESVDAADLIVSNAATDLLNADRVTFVSRMRQTTMKRMQYLKVYRDVNLGTPSVEAKSAVDEEKEAITGVTISTRPQDTPFTIYECYCNIDVPGDEHKEKGDITGIPRPYKVTIDKTSRQILEIRRNWRKDDEMERPREVFVKYPFVPGFGFYELGLIHIAGNPTVTLTALLRIMVDSGIFGNFPGGLIAKGSAKQNTTDLNVPPGSFAPVDVSATQSGNIRDAVMALPYKSFDQAIMSLYQEMQTSGGRVAGAAEISVGEGRQDAPVGTTIALIEQATKVTDAVHKRLHSAQSKEFQLLRDLFRENPEDFWRFNTERETNWDSEKLLKALNDYNLVPRADPNTSSQMQRIMKAQALYQMAKADPELFQIANCLSYVLRAMGFNDPDDLTRPPGEQGQAPDPKAEAAMISAQADATNASAKLADVQIKAKNLSVENQNRDKDRAADLTIAATKLKTEQVIHGTGLAADAATQQRQHAHDRNLQANDQLHEAGLAAQQNLIPQGAQ